MRRGECLTVTLDQMHAVDDEMDRLKPEIAALANRTELRSWLTTTGTRLRRRGGWTEDMVNAVRATAPGVWRRNARGTPGKKQRPGAQGWSDR